MNDRNLIPGRGRPKNSLNKVNAIAKTHFETLLNGNLQQINKDIAELKPYERLKILLEITSYIIPKLKAVQVTEIKENDFEPIVLVYESE